MDLVWYASGRRYRFIWVQPGISCFRRGERIPFSIENFAYKDRYGRETVTWNRKFNFPNAIRQFDATMIYSSERSAIVDYLGSKQHLAVDLEISASPNGGIRIRSVNNVSMKDGSIRFPRSFTGIERFANGTMIGRTSTKYPSKS